MKFKLVQLEQRSSVFPMIHVAPPPHTIYVNQEFYSVGIG